MVDEQAVTEISTYIGNKPDIPGFEIIQTVGKGGMGEVYLARQTNGLDREVAVKTILNEHSGDYFRRKFLEEGQRQAELHHPHILPIFVAGEAEGCLFLAMHYARDGSLRDRLNKGRLTTAESVSIVWDVLKALEHAHCDLDKPLAHLDVKPDNILFDNGNVFLSDFGIARKLQEKSGPATMVAGDPRYWAPEQQANAASIKSDLFALGIMFFELLSGDRPPPNLRVISGRASAKALQKKLPEDAQKYGPLIARCLNGDPDQRPTTGEMLEEFHRLEQKPRKVLRNLLLLAFVVGVVSLVAQPASHEYGSSLWEQAFPPAQYRVEFSITPLASELWIDGREETFRSLELTQGTHTVAIVADGYVGKGQSLVVEGPGNRLVAALEKLPAASDEDYLSFSRSFGVDEVTSNMAWKDPTLVNIARLDQLEENNPDNFNQLVQQLASLAAAGDAVASTSLFYAAFEGIQVPGGAEDYLPSLIDASDGGYAIASLLRALYILQDLLQAEQTFDSNPQASMRVKQMLQRAAEQGLPRTAVLAAKVAGISLDPKG